MGLNEEYEAFAKATWPRLVRAARLMGNSQDLAEEASQASLVSCYVRWRKIGRMAVAPDAYAYRCLVNQLARRSRNREVPVPELADRAIGYASENEANERVTAALRDLPEAQRSVVVCVFYLDLTEAATAEVLGVPLGTVKSRKARAMTALGSDPRILQPYTSTKEKVHESTGDFIA